MGYDGDLGSRIHEEPGLGVDVVYPGAGILSVCRVGCDLIQPCDVEGSLLDLLVPFNLCCGLLRVFTPRLSPKVLIYPPERRTFRVRAQI